MSRQGQDPPLPNQNGRDEEEASSQEEGEALHEVQSGWVERVEDARGHQHGQAVHTGHRRKESTWKGIDTVLQRWKNPGSRGGSASSQLCDLGQTPGLPRPCLLLCAVVKTQ